LDDLRIDFEGIAEHIFKLYRAARNEGSGLALVILDPGYLPRVFATRRGAELKSLPFMAKPAWVRHDDHYHVDFAVECKPISR
jgi:penicillin-insensitive murein endopeptidase